MTSRIFWTCPLLLLTMASAARADDEAVSSSEDQSQFGVMPMASEGSDPKLERRLSRVSRPKYDRRDVGTGAVFAFHGGVPLLVGSGVDRNVVRPGGSFSFLGGADFGYFAVEGELGFAVVPFELTTQRESLKRVHLNVGARVQVPNESPLMPYLGVSFASQWWKFNAPTGCTPVVCSTGDSFKFAPGIDFRAGFVILVSRTFGIDLGLRYNLSFKGNNVFTQTQSWLEPSLGFRVWL